ncbi:uncharacterized protein BX664DRAFT_326542 [Halteromyces radiatus]|uniref:uncharacterized protein n=1 Tax=Halteromyces radiatus TaxID=101107 RepID=UPI00221FEBE8|nr:uncharacterized protein BX664DRAFT_326542 [Halteromyces radiatus]KAI8097496.1 hypothetical protein BX664DRAFT_326542 [Halteromyces radiatus]
MKVTWIIIGLLSIVNASSAQSIGGQPPAAAASPTGPTSSNNNPSTPSASPSTTGSPVTEQPTTSPQGPVLCSDQTVFELCLKNQDNYIKGCRSEEYACLCRWHSSKLSCYDNCPQDAGKLEQSRTVKDVCSQPGANVTLPAQSWTPPTSSLLPTATGMAPTSVSSATNNNQKSGANQLMPVVVPSHRNDMCFLAIALVIVGWMF